MLYQTKNPHGGDVYERPIRLDFSANTNPHGTPPGVLEAVRCSLPRLREYPDPYCRALDSAIAAAEDVPAEYILCGAGAAELIYSYCAALRPKRAVELAPTFSEYSLGLSRTGGEMARYALSPDDGFRLGGGFLDFLAAERPEAVFLCNPNNPTGRLIDPALLADIFELCKREGIRLFLDECFLDLTERGRSLRPRLADFPGLFLLKAFTKSYGMAGLRLGYCLSADAALLHRMGDDVQPWNVSVPAQAAGVAALRETAFLEKAKRTIETERPRLAAALAALGLAVCPSDANYLLFSGPAGLDAAMKAEGIAIRSCANYHGLGEGWYRVAVRLPEENDELAAALRRCLGRKER